MSDNEISNYGYRLVPDGWLRSKVASDMPDLCYYPPKRDWPKVEKWLKEKREYKDSWKAYEVEVLGKADNSSLDSFRLYCKKIIHYQLRIFNDQMTIWKFGES